MKSKYFQPYGLNLQYEFNTYKHVGMDYGNCKTANLGCFLNLMRFNRKYITNRKETSYKVCDTYTEWKYHIEEILPKGFYNYDDMLNWLHGEKRREERLLEAIKAILIPMYIAFLGIIEFVEPFSAISVEGGSIEMMVYNIVKMLFFIIIMLIVVIVSAKALRDAEEKVDFYVDLISIAEEERKLCEK